MSLLPTTHYKLIIHCKTYNHASYIEESMNGFCIQETNFPFVAIIIDDASTDGEPEVIKKYLDDHFDMNKARYEENNDAKMTFAIHKTNTNCHFLVIYLKYNFYSIKKPKAPLYKGWDENVPYLAVCEGDDYWTNPQKIQKQVSVLDSHPECSIAFNLVQVISKDGKKQNWTIPRKNTFDTGIITIEDYMRWQFYYGSWALHTSSYCYRAILSEKYINDFDVHKKFPYGDMPLLLFCLINGNGYYINEQGGCYRYMCGGYTSIMVKNKELGIKDEKKLINALMAFDEYTQFKYHRFIKLRINRAYWRIETKYKQKRYAFLKPKYWNLRHCEDFKANIHAICYDILNSISFGLLSKLTYKRYI